MSRAIYVASGAADAQALAGSATIVGFSARESAASAAAATVILRNGATDTSPIVGFVELAADASQTMTVPAVGCPNGIFVERVAGTSELVVYVL